MFLAKMLTLRSLPEIGRRFGGRTQAGRDRAKRTDCAINRADKSGRFRVDAAGAAAQFAHEQIFEGDIAVDAVCRILHVDTSGCDKGAFEHTHA